MAIVVVGAEKGGVGKSTIAVNLVVSCAAQGKDVLLIDTDKQGSAQQWAAARREEGILPAITCIGLRGKSLKEEVRALKDKYDHIVIDAGGQDSIELRAAMMVADLIVTPCEPSQFDIFSTFTMDRLVGEVRTINEGLAAVLLVNCAPTNAQQQDVAEMREALADMQNYTILATEVHSRKAYRRCARDGRATSEYPRAETDDKAVAEMAALAAEVWVDERVAS
jgi:chromosome partitioning protein